jgi:hypothetical protein
MDIEQRLARLERENRALRRGFVVLVAVCVTGFLSVVGPILPADAQTTSRVVTAERFVLVTPNGDMRAELGIDSSSGQPQLVMYAAAPSRTALIALGTTATGGSPVLRLSREGGPGLAMFAVPDQAWLGIFGAGDSSAGVELSTIAASHTGQAIVRDADGAPAWSAP